MRKNDMKELTRKQKREILINNYVRALTLIGEKATCICDNVEYKYDGKNLIIINIDIKGKKNLVIDPIYDIWDVKNASKIQKIESLDLGSIRRINTNFQGGNLEHFIAKNVRTLPNHCFNCCTKLTFIDTPNIQNIGDECFFNCKSLSKINMPRVVTLGRNCINSTGIKELVLGNLSFSAYSQAIKNNEYLKTVTFQSVKNVSYDLDMKHVKYLDIGYFYDSIYYFDFDNKHSLIDYYKVSILQLEHEKQLCYNLLEHNLLTGQILKYYTSHEAVCRNHTLRDFLSSCICLKEFHFKLPQGYIDLGLDEYYTSLFQSYVNDTCKVILDR